MPPTRSYERMRTILLALKPGTLTPDQMARVERVAPESTSVVMTRDRGEIRAMLDTVEITAGWFPADLLREAKNLRWYQQWSAGADWLLSHPQAVEADFVLTNVSGIHATQITEHVFALLLAFARELPEALKAQGQHHWIQSNQHDTLFELAEKTMLLIGVGAVGERIAQVATAFDLRVLGIRRDPRLSVPGVDLMAGPHQLLDLLPEADVVVMTLPLTEETRGMITKREFIAMKQTGIMINVGRGGTIDENDLLHALRENWIAGAGLDVFETEPLPETSPLWNLDNLIITSHYAGITPHYHERALRVFLDNLTRYTAGRPLQNIVDKELGY